MGKKGQSQMFDWVLKQCLTYNLILVKPCATVSEIELLKKQRCSWLLQRPNIRSDVYDIGNDVTDDVVLLEDRYDSQ